MRRTTSRTVQAAGDALPDWATDKQQQRLAKVRAAKAALEAEAKAAPLTEGPEPAPSSGMTDHGRGAPRTAARRSRRSATSPIPTAGSSGTKDGFIQGYNGRLAVDAAREMYIESVPNHASPPAALLRESYREAGRTRKRTLANLTRWPPELVEGLRTLLKGGRALAPGSAGQLTLLRALPHGHFAAVLGLVRQLDLPRLLLGRGGQAATRA